MVFGLVKGLIHKPLLLTPMQGFTFMKSFPYNKITPYIGLYCGLLPVIDVLSAFYVYKRAKAYQMQHKDEVIEESESESDD